MFYSKMIRARLYMKISGSLFIIALSSVLFMVQGGVSMAQNEEIKLPQPRRKSGVSLEEVISKRRSQRSFSQNEIELDKIGQLLWAAQGVTLRQKGINFRTVPSAGALYPLEIYLVYNKGVFRYMPLSHGIELVKKDDVRADLSEAALGQQPVKNAAVDIVICSVYERITGKYQDRGIRYAYMEAGHAAQNIHLQAVALGLGTVSIGAFRDDKVKEVLSLPQDHEPVYIIPVGYGD